MLASMRHWLKLDMPVSKEQQSLVTESEENLINARGEYRQVVQRISTGIRLMSSWEEANRMLGGRSD